MQNTPPVARRFLVWSFQASPLVVSCRKRLHTYSSVLRDFVKQRFGTEEWTEWAPGVLESLGADEPAPGPVGPSWAGLSDRARLLLDLGMDFARVAEVLQVSAEDLLRAVPRVDGRVLLPSPRAYSPVERLREESW